MKISKGKWSLGKQLGTVITDDGEGFPSSYQGDSLEYYGGYVIAESISKPADAALIAAAPELLAACQEFVRKVECGEAHSRRSYAQMKEAITKAQK